MQVTLPIKKRTGNSIAYLMCCFICNGDSCTSHFCMPFLGVVVMFREVSRLSEILSQGLRNANIFCKCKGNVLRLQFLV